MKQAKHNLVAVLAAMSLTLGASIATSAQAEEASKQEDKIVSLFAWADYFPDSVIQAFQKETGITVKYDTFDSNEILETRLSTGGAGYDVVVPNASPHLARQIPAGFYRVLDRSKLPHYGNLDPEVLKVLSRADPGNKFAVPWMWGMTGIGYNKAAVLKRIPDAQFDSLSLLLDPANAKRLADCGIGIVDSDGEMIPAALAYLGKQPFSGEAADIDAAVAQLQKITPYVKSFTQSGQTNNLADGEMCVVFGYSGDVYIAQTRASEAGRKVEIGFASPRELSQAWIDSLAIPKDAPHPDNAYKFIDYMLRAESAATATTEYGFASGNKAALALLDPAIRNNPSIYPPDTQMSVLQLTPLQGPAYDRALLRAWTKVKTGK